MDINQRINRLENLVFKESKQVGILYHYTYLTNLVKILDNNTLKISPNHGWVSFTRDKNAWKSIASIYPVCIVVDGNKLSNNYQIKPYQDSYSGTSIKRIIKDEMEEVVLKDIKNITNYITSIILFENECENEFSDWDEEDWLENFNLEEGNTIDIKEFIENNFNLKVSLK